MTINIDNISSIHNKMLDNNIHIAYKGVFNNETLNTLLSNAKKQLTDMHLDVPVRKKIYNIMVECLENIHKHTGERVSEKGQNPHYPLFVMGKSGDNYYITAGNLVYDKDIDVLKQKLDDIRHLDKEKLKDKYREAMLKGEFSEKGGVGIGIIDMALKSDNKIEYIFKTIEENITFFILEIKVSE